MLKYILKGLKWGARVVGVFPSEDPLIRLTGPIHMNVDEGVDDWQKNLMMEER